MLPSFGPPRRQPPRMQGLYTNSALFWAPKKAGLRQLVLILYPLLGTQENAGVR